MCIPSNSNVIAAMFELCVCTGSIRKRLISNLPDVQNVSYFHPKKCQGNNTSLLLRGGREKESFHTKRETCLTSSYPEA